jgi:hypothetical protein
MHTDMKRRGRVRSVEALELVAGPPRRACVPRFLSNENE